MDLKTPNKEDLSFTANGHKYYIESKLSIERFIAYQKLEIELAYDVGFLGVIQNLNKAISHLNKLELVNASVVLSNTILGIQENGNKKIPALDLCSLFINREDEDRRIITDEMMIEKQKDWEKEGIEVSFFLTCAYNFVRGYRDYLKNISHTTSQ